MMEMKELIEAGMRIVEGSEYTCHLTRSSTKSAHVVGVRAAFTLLKEHGGETDVPAVNISKYGICTTPVNFSGTRALKSMLTEYKEALSLFSETKAHAAMQKCIIYRPFPAPKAERELVIGIAKLDPIELGIALDALAIENNEELIPTEFLGNSIVLANLKGSPKTMKWILDYIKSQGN